MQSSGDERTEEEEEKEERRRSYCFVGPPLLRRLFVPLLLLLYFFFFRNYLVPDLKKKKIEPCKSLIFFFLGSAKIYHGQDLSFFFFGFITWFHKGVLLCIFICGIYFVDLWTWCNGPEFGFGEFILYIFEHVANLVVKEGFFLYIWVMYIGFMYGFVIFMYYFLWYIWVCDFCIWVYDFERENDKSKSKLL